MTRLMYDSTSAADIPADAAMVAGYLPPSRYAWSAAAWARFPHAVKVRIAIFASVNDGHVLDVEQGDATPAQAPSWVAMRRLAGTDPTVYCSQSLWATVRAEFARQGVPQPHYWIARYDNVSAIPAGAVAKQYANEPLTGGHYDLSIVADHWPGVDQETDMTPEEREWLRQIYVSMSQPYSKRGIDVGQVFVNLVDLPTQLAAVIAVVRAQPSGGQVDVPALAAALAPLMPAETTPEQIAEAVRHAFAEHLGAA